MVALLGGEPFSIDPIAVTWDYRGHLVDKPMSGGKVVQVFGADIGDIKVTGRFGSMDNIETQLAFLKRMKKMSSTLATHPEAKAYRFFWPEQGWDFMVNLKEYNQRGGPAAQHTIDNYAPQWNLTLMPVGGTDQLKTATVTMFIERLSAGIGWRLTKYNGPATYNEVAQTLTAAGVSTLDEFNRMAYGLGTAPSNVGLAPETSGAGTAFATGRNLTAEEMLNLGMQATGWRGEELVIMVAVAGHESGGWNPRALNSIGAAGLWQINTSAHGDKYGTVEELFVPERNAQAAYGVYTARGGGENGRQAWTSYTHAERYQKYMPEVTAKAQQMGII